MVQDAATADTEVEESTVMAAVDADRLVIADVDRDDAWLSVALSEAVAPSDHR